jgi:outer membrane receptor protein involved in Fe transport
MRLKRNNGRRTGAPMARSRTTISQTLLPPAEAILRRMGPSVSINALAAAVAGILYCTTGSTAHAQAAVADTAAAAPSELEELVVTASANAVKKLDASYNIVAANIEDIKQENPKSSADILKLSPGIWPESSGGQTGANIEIAGIPGGGDAPFFTNMINGTPMYGMPSLSFMDSSSLFRLDDTIDRVEIVQGGPGAVFGPGQMGATANFILRRGTADPAGSVGLTYGSEGLVRVDAFYGFPIAPGWYASAGGFYRESDGVRDPQFKADKGGQFTATITHDLDNGSFMLWARTLQDKNQFIVPVPLIQNSNGSYSNYPGFDSLTSSFGSHAIQNVTLPNPAGGFESADLANGRGGSLNFLGGQYDVDLSGWKISDKFIWNGGDLNTNALFSGPNPRPLSYFLYGCQVAQAAGFCNGATPVDSNNYSYPVTSGAGAAGAMPLPGSVTATYAGGGAVDPNQSVISQGWWYIQKRLMNLNNDFRVSKEIFDSNTATAGIYAARYTDHDNWSLGNNMLMTNTPNARPIVLTQATAGGTYNLTNGQGIYNYNNNYNIVEDGYATNIAPYLSDSWKFFDRLLVDASARYEHIQVIQQTCNRTGQALGTGFDLYDINTPICNGTFDIEHYTKSSTTWTVGANYEFFNNMSAYVRANNGTHFDDFDNGIRGAGGNFAPVETIKNYETGFKWQTQWVYLDVSAYHKQFTGLQYQETDVNGNPLTAISNYGADSKGIDFIATVTPVHNLNVKFIGDYMDGHYTHYDGCAQYQDINGNTQCIGLDGKPLQRQPKFQIRIIPSYKIEAGFADITLWANYEHVGQRYEDQSGLQPLGSYYMLGGGILAQIGNNWEVRLQGTNLTNQIALTEGNARIFGANAGIGGVMLGRPIEGREGNIGVKYKF